MEWTKMEEKEPEYTGIYLIVCGGKVICAYRQMLLGAMPIWNNDFTGGLSIIPDEKVSYWLEIPEPPKDEV